MVITVVKLEDVPKRLESLKRGALVQIGALLESQAQRAFQEQKLGDERWEPRYPNQSEPFMNIAGAVSDWNRGAKIKSRRFQRRPAGIDTGALRGSVRSEVVGDEVRAGSRLPYASQFQFGGISILKVTKSAKQEAARFLLTAKGKQFRDKLTFILNPNLNQLDTELVPRPFLGITSETEEDIQSAVQESLSDG